MAKKIINIGDVKCGSKTLFLISGPCVIEERATMLKTAEKLKTVSKRLGMPLIFKSSFQKDNRSAIQNYRGPGITEGLEILKEIRKSFDIPVTSDIHYPAQAEEAKGVLDVIQVPAYLCMQTDLLVAAAKSKKPISIKHGQFLSPENMTIPIKKAEDSGCNKILLIERGYTFGYNDLIVDPRSFYHLGKTGYPVVFDVTHSIRKYGIPSSRTKGGSREYMGVISRAGTAAGIDGLFIETHIKPSSAKCDASTQMNIHDLEEFLKPLIEIHNTVKGR